MHKDGSAVDRHHDLGEILGKRIRAGSATAAKNNYVHSFQKASSAPDRQVGHALRRNARMAVVYPTNVGKYKHPAPSQRRPVTARGIYIYWVRLRYGRFHKKRQILSCFGKYQEEKSRQAGCAADRKKAMSGTIADTRAQRSVRWGRFFGDAWAVRDTEDYRRYSGRTFPESDHVRPSSSGGLHHRNGATLSESGTIMMAGRREFWGGRQVLVTGATGLLGGYLVRELLELGANVVALVRDGMSGSELKRSGLIQQVTTVQGSITDLALFRRIMAEYSIQTVFHLAAQSLVGKAKLDPLGTLEANIQGSWVVLEAARLAKACQVLVASSFKAYGDPVELPYREDMPLAGKYPYDVSKSCVDLISAMYASTYGLPVGIGRCANLFGGGDLNFSRSIPGLIKAALLDEPFEIRSDGKFVRDFLYAGDAADAYLTLAEKVAA